MTVSTLRPNADVSVGLARSTGSYNYACIDEATEDVTDYVRLALVYDELSETTHNGSAVDRYGFPNHGSETGIINKVTIKAQAKYSALTGSSPSAQIKLGVYVNSTAYYASPQNLTTLDTLYYSVWNTNPYTTVAWTWSQIDDLQTLLYLSGSITSSGPTKDGYYVASLLIDAFQYWVEVEYLSGAHIQVLIF